MFYKIDENNAVVQIQPNAQKGFFETDKNIVCGMIDNGDGSFSLPGKPIEYYIERLAKRRYEAEIGGTVINGVDISTDRESQSKLIALRIVAKEDANYTVNWKTANGFVVLDATTIIALADGVRQHVQNCFDNEANLLNQIENASNPSTVDIEIGWP